ncbi:serine/threonine-protein kinase [Prauserella muralis]|uniref:non-specific serine/threonine protein kinase n=1 Tax=Prauserella muralis TaxID=588067 RepID=A0A2V4BA22_9PSEU|nr:serine/threonine-protein kinase [Prauserella muralis]PXY32128.1 hypothetical protein BAY60_07490 [Prauserella muralis]TWE24218.1 YVTN family beta-propeller protein [Prauserella muralis]
MTAELFGPYRLDALIGRGGMGEVYRAYDTRKDRVVALKRLPHTLAADADFQARFRRESRVAARLREPHVIPIHDYGEIDGLLFLDMRLVDGVDLATLLHRDGPLEPDRAVRVVAQVAGALDAAHADGLVHRDVKPSNVLLSGDDHVYLVDFGIASSATGTRLTGTGDMIGTPHYMAPERFGSGRVDARSDVYALTCVLYEALTGHKPFAGEDALAQLYAHANRVPPAPSRTRPGVPAGFDAVVAKGMAKEPADRFAGAGELASAARAALETAPAPATEPFVTQPVTTPIPPTPPPREPARGGRRAALAVAGVVLVGAVAGMVILLSMRGDGDTPPADPTASRRPAAVTAAATIPVGQRPEGVAVSPDGARVYVTNSEAGTVSVLAAGDGRVVATVDVGAEPGGVAVSPDGAVVYVADYGSDTVSVIDAGRAEVTTTIPVGPSPDRVAFAADGDRAYVTNDAAGTVTILDTVAHRVAGTVAAGPKPFDVLVSPDGGELYVADAEDGTLTGLAAASGEVTRSIALGGRLQDSALSPDGATAYVPDQNGGTLAVVRTGDGSVEATVQVGTQPQGAAVSPDGRRVYVVGADGLVVLDAATRKVVARVPVGAEPLDVAVSPDGARAYVALGGGNAVRVVRLR